jgi:hypothetical protein
MHPELDESFKSHGPSQKKKNKWPVSHKIYNRWPLLTGLLANVKGPLHIGGLWCCRVLQICSQRGAYRAGERFVLDAQRCGLEVEPLAWSLLVWGRALSWAAYHCIARSGVTVTRLLCDPLPYKNVLRVPHAKNLGENNVLAVSTKCTKRSPRFSRVRYSGSGYNFGW